VKRSGTLVASWSDRTGEHLVSAVEIAERPMFVAHSPLLNGRPAIRFSGTGEVLEETGDLCLPFGSDPLSAFAVVAPGSFGVHLGAPMVWTGEDGISHAALWIDSSNRFLAWVERHVQSGITLMHGRPAIIGVVFDGATVTAYVNGTPVKAVTNVRGFVQDAADAILRLGSGTGGIRTFHGDLGDVLVYDRALDEREIDDLHRHLLGYYRMRGILAPAWVEAIAEAWGAMRDRMRRIVRPLLSS
jgi:hypothetical protein